MDDMDFSPIMLGGVSEMSGGSVRRHTGKSRNLRKKKVHNKVKAPGRVAGRAGGKVVGRATGVRKRKATPKSSAKSRRTRVSGKGTGVRKTCQK